MRYRYPQPFHELDHTADAAILVRGADADETLARLVLALASLLTGGAPIEPSREVQITVEPGDRAAVAVDVLRELLYLFDVERVVPESVEVLNFAVERGANLRVTVGDYDPDAHVEGTELKAVTLHDAEFAPEADGGFRAQVIFDL